MSPLHLKCHFVTHITGKENKKPKTGPMSRGLAVVLERVSWQPLGPHGFYALDTRQVQTKMCHK
jgi:hypothetical protein